VIHLNKKHYPYLEEINIAVLKQIPISKSFSAEQAVLDVGCGQANLSLEIKKKGYCVWGVEENEFAATKAQSRIDNVIVRNLIAFDKIEEEIKAKQFDYIVFSDVLEHLYDPLSVLNFYLQFLKSDGRVIISVPNAVVWSNRLSFLWGKFEYDDTGVMDRTHIRFFTFKTAKQLVAAAGCAVCHTDLSPFIVRACLPILKKIMIKKSDKNNSSRAIIDSPFYRLYERFIYPIEYAVSYCWRTLFAFRIVVVGKKLGLK